jgi:flagellar basal body P-ring formation protein FlgA
MGRSITADRSLDRSKVASAARRMSGVSQACGPARPACEGKKPACPRSVRSAAGMLAALLLVVPLAATPAMAQEVVTAKPVSVVDAPVLRLGDIFAGAGAREDVVIGAAPAPGHRLVVEPAQLLALARRYGLVWRPLSASERSVIERPGRAMPAAEVSEALRADLLRLGMDPEAELDLGAFLPPVVPPSALPQLTIEGLGYDPASGRFTATLVVMAEGVSTQRLRLAGRALPTVPVVVATRRLALGDVLRAADLRQTRMRAERVRPGAAETPEQVLGQQLRRPLAEGLPVMTADLGPPAVVAKNALVVMLLEAPGLSLTMQGRALDSAPRGGVVPVMNLESHAVVEAQAIAPGQVRVVMGAVPVQR